MIIRVPMMFSKYSISTAQFAECEKLFRARFPGDIRSKISNITNEKGDIIGRRYALDEYCFETYYTEGVLLPDLIVYAVKYLFYEKYKELNIKKKGWYVDE